jgi:hypothetical protein
MVIFTALGGKRRHIFVAPILSIATPIAMAVAKVTAKYAL